MRIPTVTALIEAKLNEADQGMINQFHDHLADEGFKRQPDRTVRHTSQMRTKPSDHPHGSEPWQHGTKVQHFSSLNGQSVFLKPLDDGTVEYRTHPAPGKDEYSHPTKLGTDFSEFQSTLDDYRKGIIKSAQRMASVLLPPGWHRPRARRLRTR
jgi:hypothetical protein